MWIFATMRRNADTLATGIGRAGPWSPGMRGRCALALAAAAMVALAGPQVRASSHLMGHITIEEPGQLTGPEAQEVYAELAERMAEGYARAGIAIVDGYQGWTRYNTAPYLSSTHGNRYVNNYANDIAANYRAVATGSGLSLPRRIGDRQGLVLAHR